VTLGVGIATVWLDLSNIDQVGGDAVAGRLIVGGAPLPPA
jgi:hypothetical protein